VYIMAGVTYYSQDWDASGATYWMHDASGWYYYGGTEWKPVGGLGEVPNSGTSIESISLPGYLDSWGIPDEVVALNGDAYFPAMGFDELGDPNGTNLGTELYKYDRETQTISVAADIVPGGESSGPHTLRVVDGKLYFFANAGSDLGPIELFCYTPGGGCAQLTHIGGPEYSSVTLTSSAGLSGKLYFGYDDGSHGYELWSYNIQTGAATLVADIFSGPEGSNPHHFGVLDGYLYFSARPNDTGSDLLWRYDPGTSSLSEVPYPPPTSAFYWQLQFAQEAAWNQDDKTVLNGVCYHSWYTIPTGYELFSVDLSTGTHTLVADVFPGYDNSSMPYWVESYNGAIYFDANDGVHGKELWRYDPVSHTATLVADLGSGNESDELYGPEHLTSLGTELIFWTYDAYTSGVQFWRCV
jgi:ELWxxDGT repeat protein